MLAAMFSGRHTVCKDSEKGYVFIDRDGKHFRHVLNWLRDGVVPNLTDSECSELLREAEYYQLLGLVDGITQVLNRKNDVKEMDTDLTRTDIIKWVRSKNFNCSLRGVNLSGINLSGINLSNLDLSNVDFSYTRLKNVSFSHANLERATFQGVVAESTIFTLQNCAEHQSYKYKFRGSQARRSQSKGCHIEKCQFGGCKPCTHPSVNLRDTRLDDGNLERMNLSWEQLDA